MLDTGSFPQGVAALSRELQLGRISAVEATQYYLARIDALDDRLNSFITVAAEQALAQAAIADTRRANGKRLGPLDGIPIALKDNIDLVDMPTTAGVAARRQHKAPADAAVTANLRDAGVVFLGKTNMHEAALGATTDNPSFGRCHNPHRYNYTPGGSSGGSAAAVTAGLCAAALGTDTLGSVRIPASYCGNFGYKPSDGLVSKRGIVPLSWTLDQVGLLAPRAEDLWLMLMAMSGFDPACPDSRPLRESFHPP